MDEINNGDINIEMKIYCLNQIKDLKKECDQLLKKRNSSEKTIKRLSKSIQNLEESIQRAQFLDSLANKKQHMVVEKKEIEKEISVKTKQVVGLIAREWNVDQEEAEEDFQLSNSYRLLYDENSKLYLELPEKIFQNYMIERKELLEHIVSCCNRFLEEAAHYTEETISLLEQQNINIFENDTMLKNRAS